jgi:hypothetical protein
MVTVVTLHLKTGIQPPLAAAFTNACGKTIKMPLVQV